MYQMFRSQFLAFSIYQSVYDLLAAQYVFCLSYSEVVCCL